MKWYVAAAIGALVLLIWFALPRWYGVMPGFWIHGWMDCDHKSDPCHRIARKLAFGPLG